LDIAYQLSGDTVGTTKIIINPAAVPPTQVDYLISYAGPAAHADVVLDGFNGNPGFKYVEAFGGTPSIRLCDQYDNLVANNVVIWSVAGGGGRVINRYAQQCRDMGVRPFDGNTQCTITDSRGLAHPPVGLPKNRTLP